MKITEKTKCWICGRNAEELKRKTEEYWQSGELGKDMDLDACFPDIVEVKKFAEKEKIEVPVCVICQEIITGIVLRELRDRLKLKIQATKPKILFKID